MAIAIIAGVTTLSPLAGSVVWQPTLNGRDTFNCTILSLVGGYVPQVGEPFAAFDGPTKIFGGSIDQTTKRPVAITKDDLFIDLLCVGHDRLLDKRFAYDPQTNRVPVYKSYTGKVKVEGTAVTWLSGDLFDTELKGRNIQLNLQVGTAGGFGTTIGPVELLTVAVADVTSLVSLIIETSPQDFTEIAWFFTWTAGAVLRDLINVCAFGEGLTTNNVDEGANISTKITGGMERRLNEIRDELAKQSDYVSWIDPDKDVHFVSRSVNAAPFSITNSTKIQNVSLTETREDYRNIDLHKVAPEAIGPKEESFTGDGATFAWQLAERVESIDSISVDGETKEVGILETQTGERDPGKEFFYNVGERIIVHIPLTGSAGGSSFTTGNPNYLTANQELLVRYRPLGSDVIVYEDFDKVAERIEVESETSGKYPHFTDDTKNPSVVDATAKAIADIQRFGTIPKKFPYRTCTQLIPTASQLRPGQVQSINRPQLGVNDSFLIVRIRGYDAASPVGTDNLPTLWYEVEAVTGTYTADYLDVYRKFLDKGSGKSVVQSSGSSSSKLVIAYA